MGERRRDGFGERPWASLFDPAAKARALGDIQRRGLQAAGELVDRLVGAADGDAHVPTDDSTGRQAESDHDNGQGARAVPGGSTAAAGVVQVWVDLFQRGLQAITDVTVTGATPSPASNGHGGATVDLGAGATTGTVRIAVAGDGARADSEVWLHNGTSAPIAGLSLHCGDLRAHDGSVLPASAVRFDPDGVDELPARSSRGVVVSADIADIADDQLVGTYRGVILAAGAPDVWLPLELTVGEREQ